MWLIGFPKLMHFGYSLSLHYEIENTFVLIRTRRHCVPDRHKIALGRHYTLPLFDKFTSMACVAI